MYIPQMLNIIYQLVFLVTFYIQKKVGILPNFHKKIVYQYYDADKHLVRCVCKRQAYSNFTSHIGPKISVSIAKTMICASNLYLINITGLYVPNQL